MKPGGSKFKKSWGVNPQDKPGILKAVEEEYLY